MCSFCPNQDGVCIVCGAVRVSFGSLVLIPSAMNSDGKGSVVRLLKDREEHQLCGGGRRIIRKKVGHN